MRLRSNDRYFDFDGDIDVEKQSKLFEGIDETTGDFSYQFDIPRTGNNMQILGFPTADAVKSIYKSVPCDLLDEDNIALYTGQIRVERPNNVAERTMSCSFFSGNYNWIGELGGPIVTQRDSDGNVIQEGIDFSDLDTDLSETEIINNGVNTDGIFFPLLDAGALITRSSSNLLVKDFTGTIFLKTIFHRIFQNASIKLAGDLLTDPIFNSALIAKTNIDANAINDRSCYVGKGSTQNISVTDGLLTKITFTDETSPFFDGSQNNFSSSTYTADADMDVKIECYLRFAETSTPPFVNDNIVRFRIYIDGTEVFHQSIGLAGSSISQKTSMTYSARLDAGSTVEIYAFFIAFPDPYTFSVYSDSWIKVTPSFVYRVFGNSLVPNWTQAQFVNNVLSLLCCICDYEPFTKTLTIDFFNGIKSKEPIDISEYITITHEDTSDFISNFAKNNLLKYQDSDADDIKEYNVKYSEPYAAGVINVDNDFVPNTGTILTSDFKAPVSYINPAFTASLERINFVEMEQVDSTEFTSIQDTAGRARINMADASIFRPLEICRITKCSVPEYNGDWLVTSTVSTNFLVIDRPFSGDATGTITRMVHKYTNSNDVYIFIAATYDDDNVARFSDSSSYQLVENEYSNISYAFFNLIDIGSDINDDYKQGLAFGVVKNQLSYQKTLLDTYWPNVDNILNDPLKLFSEGLLPKDVFLSLTPLRPIRVRNLQTDNLYYMNRITGYKNSYTTCIPELIKLS